MIEPNPSKIDSQQSFVPKEFEVPKTLENKHFRLRMLSVEDVYKDYEAVISSAPRLRALFKQWGGWPRDGFTVQENLEDLRQHQEEFEQRKAFAYTVTRLDESAILGCVYINPSQNSQADAEVLMWVRESEFEKGLDSVLFQEIDEWLRKRWPFRAVIYPGRIAGIPESKSNG